MQVQQALRGSPVKQAIGNEGSAMVIVTRLKEGTCQVSVIAGDALCLQVHVPDEQAVEQVLWEQLHLQEIAFKPVQTRSYTASPFRTKPERAKLVRKSGWPAFLFSLKMLVLRAIRVIGRKARSEKKIHQWSPEQVLQWLYFLTRHTLERQALAFSPEDLQSSWLAGPSLRLYRWSLKLVVGAGSGLLFGLGCAVFVYLSTGWLNPTVLFGVMGGLLFSLLCGLLFRPSEGLRPEKTIRWRQKWLKRTLIVFLLCQLTIVIPYLVVANDVSSEAPLSGLALTICFGSLFGLSTVLFFPFPDDENPNQITTSHSPLLHFLATPDEGVRQRKILSLLPWLLVSLICGLLFGVLSGGLVGLFSQPYGSPGWLLCTFIIIWLAMVWPILGLCIWLPACLAAGPTVVAQPLLLRLFLQRFNGLPWNLHSLLDQAVERGWLRTVKGSYRPAPRLLLAYFDSLDQPFPPHIAVLQNPFTVASFPIDPVRGQPIIITYDGLLLATAQHLTMHWGYNGWRSITDTEMRRSYDGTWQATLTVPPEATVLSMAFYDQNNTWDNRQHKDYHLLVREGLP